MAVPVFEEYEPALDRPRAGCAERRHRRYPVDAPGRDIRPVPVPVPVSVPAGIDSCPGPRTWRRLFARRRQG
ncbi:hypothetical protein ABZ707_16800 [Streptomyces sp. NPDC006923]|uniref:hypothetical protein n=1 Tax=Streptomyces sp. NPDC006923 TaxID=3155355 RepID=UPI0033CE1D30